MRRFELLLTIFVALCGTSALSAQTQSLWSPCGCPPGQCGGNSSNGCSSSDGCSSGTCGNCGACCNRGLCNGGLCDGDFDCLNLHDPRYFQPWNLRPFGLYNERIYEAQRRNGAKAQFVFYDFHFAFDDATGTWSLTQAGFENAQKLARMWNDFPSQILIAPAGRPEWDTSRRELALKALTSHGVNVNSDAFVVGNSHILGLVPYEPETIFLRRQELSPFLQGYSQSTSVGAGSSSPTSSSATVGGGTSGMTPKN